MKVILIDTKNEEIKEVEHDDTLKNIYKFVDCATFDVLRLMKDCLLKTNYSLLIMVITTVIL